MSRSSKKGPFVEERLFNRIEAMNASGKPVVSVDLPSASGNDVPATVLTSRVFLPNVAASASEA